MILLLALACGAAPDDFDSAAEDIPYVSPAGPGARAVGSLEDALVSTDGLELPVQAWFPVAGDPPAEDDPDADWYIYDGLAKGVALDAPPDCAERHPVVVFSHGSGGIRWQSIFLTERLASHGYVVVAPDHVGNTMFDMVGGDFTEEQMMEAVLRRPVDVRDAFDWLIEQSADPDSPLSGCVDPDAGYAVMGHSFGGYTSLAVAGATLDLAGVAEACESQPAYWCDYVDDVAERFPGQDEVDLSDSRAWASVPMTPAGYQIFGPGLAKIQIPIAVFGGTLDDITPWDIEVQPIYGALSATPRALIGVEGAGHMSFSNACDLLPTFDECGEGYLPAADVQRIVNEIAVPWVELARGDDRAADVLPPDEDALIWEWAK